MTQVESLGVAIADLERLATMLAEPPVSQDDAQMLAATVDVTTLLRGMQQTALENPNEFAEFGVGGAAPPASAN